MHFQLLKEIQKAVMRVLSAILIEAFQNCYDAWKNRWNRCDGAQGTYIEGDHAVVQYNF